jgi:hypothetical protein
VRIIILGSSGSTVARYNPDGSPDSSFGPGGVAQIGTSSANWIGGIVEESDGNILLVGYNQSPDGSYNFLREQVIGVPPHSPVGTALSFTSTVKDPNETPTYQWTVTKDGSSYALPSGTVTDTSNFSFTPTAVGTYVVTLSVTDPDGTTVSDSKTIAIDKATPIFSLVAPPTVIDGTSTTKITGAITLGSLIPTGSVTVTVNGVSQTAAINPADGTFAVTVPTASLGTGSYTIGYFCAGDSNFTSASATAKMDVTNGVLALFNQSQAKHAGSTISIQIELVSASGQDVSSAGTTVNALGIAATTDTTDTVGSIDPSLIGALQPVQAPGNSNPNNVFKEQGGAKPDYTYNLQTPKGLTAGTYRLYIQVQGDPLLHWVTFSVS